MRTCGCTSRPFWWSIRIFVFGHLALPDSPFRCSVCLLVTLSRLEIFKRHLVPHPSTRFSSFWLPSWKRHFFELFSTPQFSLRALRAPQRTSSGIFQQCFRFFMFVHVQSRNTFLSSATALRPPASFFRPRGPEGYTTNGGTNICTSLAGPGPPLNPSATKL